MVNQSDSIPPKEGQDPQSNEIQPTQESSKAKNTGKFAFSKGREWLGMDFSAKQWNQLMNIFLKNINQYIEKTYKKAIAKMKEDWRKEKGED